MPKGKKLENPRNAVIKKQKAQKSFSIPIKTRKTLSNRKNLNAGEGCSTKPIVQVLSQEKVKNEMEVRPSTTDNSYSLTESTMFLESSASDVITGESSFMDTTQISEDLLDDDDGWQTDSSVEQMRSSDLMSFENMIPPPLSFRDDFDSASSEFLHHDSGPKASTLLSFFQPVEGKSFRFSVTIESVQEAVSKALSASRNVATQYGEPLNTSNVSSFKDLSEERDSIRDLVLGLKSPSPVQMTEIPEISFEANNESQEQREDSVIGFKAPASEGFKFCEGANEHTKQSFHEDDRYSRKSSPGASAISESTDSYSKKQKQEDEIGNSFDGPNDCSNEDSFGDAPNIHTDSFNKKGKYYRRHSSMNQSVKWKHQNEPGYLFQDTDKCDKEDDCENIMNFTNEEVQNNELNDSLPETRTNPRKAIDRLIFSSMKRRSIRFKRKVVDKEENLIKDVDCNKREVHFKGSQNIPIDTPKKEGNFIRGFGIDGTNRKKMPHSNTRGHLFKDMSKNYNEDNFENIHSIYHDREKVGISSQGTSSHRIGDSFEESRLIECDTPEKIGNGINRVKTPFRKQHVDVGERSFEDINENEDSFENIQNISCEIGNSSKDTDISDKLYDFEAQNIKVDVVKKKRFFSQGLKRRSSINIPLGKESRNKKGNSPQNMNRSDNFKNAQNGRYEVENSSKNNLNEEADFENPLNTQINFCRGIGNARKRGKSRPRKTADSFRKSQISTSVEETEDLMENQNEAEKNNWPQSKQKTFTILEPVTRDDVPIDDITLVVYDILTKTSNR